MFAVFLLEDMNPFYQNIASFPTVIFTVLLGIVVLFWLVAVIGVIDLDFLDFDLPEPDVELSADANNLSNPGALAGIFLKFGLHGVPVTIILSFIVLIGWLVSYYLVHFTLFWADNFWLRLILGLPIFLVATIAGALATAQIIKPLRKFFQHATQPLEKIVLGQTAIVRSSVVDGEFGEAVLEDGGAGLILKVRAMNPETFARGDKVVLLNYLKDKNLYQVISEQEFHNN